MEAIDKSILCVDDNDDSREILEYLFEEQGFAVTACRSLEDCLSAARRNRFSAVILDNRLQDGSSLDAGPEIRLLHPTPPIVLYSGEARETEIEKALEAGADKYLIKPLGLSELVETVEKLI